MKMKESFTKVDYEYEGLSYNYNKSYLSYLNKIETGCREIISSNYSVKLNLCFIFYNDIYLNVHMLMINSYGTVILLENVSEQIYETDIDAVCVYTPKENVYVFVDDKGTLVAKYDSSQFDIIDRVAYVAHLL